MNQADTPRPLTDDELSRMLAPVPLAQQQRDALVRVSLRPGLPADYAGLVELDDLRLSLSPWHWLKHMFAENAHSVELSQRIKDACVAGESLETVSEQANWLFDNELFDEGGNAWYSNPDDNLYFGHYGVLGEREEQHFLPPSFELQIVQFFPDELFSEGIVVAQVEWEDAHIMSACWREGNKATGPVSICAHYNESKYEWMVHPDEMWLTDSITEETYKLICGGVDELENAEDWTGVIPWIDGRDSDSTGQSMPTLVLGLRYEAGCLYRADTDALLTVELKRPEAPE